MALIELVRDGGEAVSTPTGTQSVWAGVRLLALA